MFEIKLLGKDTYTEAGFCKGRFGKAYFRIGFSTAEASLITGSDAHSIGFDNYGQVWHDGKRVKQGHAGKLFTGAAAAVVLNLDEKSPNANTVSLFVNGKRSSEPYPLPDGFRG